MNTFFTFPTVGGYVQLSESNQYIFTDTLSNDILVHTDFSNQNILIGTGSNDTSAIKISELEVSIQRNVFFNCNFAVGIRDYSERFVVGNGNVKFHDNLYVMDQIGVGTSNLTHMLTLAGPSNSVRGPHLTAYFNEVTSNPVYQIYNWNRDDIQHNFDCYNTGVDVLSTSSTGNFQIRKNLGRLQFMSACNSGTGTNITSLLYPALTINSNSFLGIATRDPTHRVTMRAENTNMLGPHLAYYNNTDSNHPVFQQLNWTHDHIEQNFDTYFNGTTWKSSSSTGNFSVQKKGGRYMIQNSCNNPAGSNIQNWFPAFVVNSNSYIGMGTSNPRHRLSIQGPSNNILGPHIATYTNDSNQPVLQIYSCNHDMISINFNSWWNGNNWISSSSNTNFQIIKRENKLIIQNAEYVTRGDAIDPYWYSAFTVNSNNYIGIRTSNPKFPLDVHGQSIFRSNIQMTGHIFPNSNMIYDLGRSNLRWKNLYLAGSKIDMENLTLYKEDIVGGLAVFDGITNRPTRVWSKELLIGDPYDPIDSNVFLVTASSNGLQLTLVEDLDIPLQDFSQLNRLFITQTHVGLGLSNPEKWWHVIGDTELNPNVTMNLGWYNNVIRMEQTDLQLSNTEKVTRWNSFTASNEFAPTFLARTGYNDGSCVRFRDQQTIISEQPLYISAFTNTGVTVATMARFCGNQTDDDTVFSFTTAASNTSNATFILKRDESDNTKLKFITDNITIVSPPNTVKQNEWALYSVRFIEDPDPQYSKIKMYKNNVEILSESLEFMEDMFFGPGDTVSIGKGNIDISSLYIFDRPLFDDEFLYLSRILLYNSRQSEKVRTKMMLYPPNDFRDDLIGWTYEGDYMLDRGFNVYRKDINNTYYGNGTYRIWTNDEYTLDGMSYCFNVFDFSADTYWSTYGFNYTNNSSPIQTPCLFMEFPSAVIVQTYIIGAQFDDPTKSPSTWKLFGSTNKSTWILIDSQAEINEWSSGEEKLFEVNSTENYRYFKLEVFQNSSPTGKEISIGTLKIFGMEDMLYLDGTGLGIGTSLVKEKLHVEGNALITKNVTIGKTIEDEIINSKIFPPQKLTGTSTYINGLKFGNGQYNVNQSAFYENNSSFAAYKVFDRSMFTYWKGQKQAYDSMGDYSLQNTGYYTEMDGIFRWGDWIQIQLPVPICLKSYTIYIQNELTAPWEFYIAASKDGNTWTQIDKKSYKWFSFDEYAIFYTNYQDFNTYTYFRLIITRIGQNSSPVNAEAIIKELELYGDVIDVPLNNVSTVAIKGDLNVTNDINLSGKNIKQSTVFDLNFKKLQGQFDTQSMVDIWDTFAQHNPTLQPIYYEDGGYRNLPYVRFQKRYMITKNRKMNISTNGGFTIFGLVKINEDSAAGSVDSILNFNQNMNNADVNAIRVLRYNMTDELVCEMYGEDGLSYDRIISAHPVFYKKEWFAFAVRYIKATKKLELFINNVKTDHIVCTTEIVDRVIENCQISTEFDDMDISALMTWDRPLSDSELFEISDIHIQGTQSLHVEKSIRVSSGIEGGLTVYGQKTHSTFITYPPADLESNDTLVKNNVCGSGRYIISCSQYYENNDQFNCYNAFCSNNLSWRGEKNIFSGITGLYDGTSVTTANNIEYPGEWIQILLPQDVILYEYTIKPAAPLSTTAPRAWKLFASKNGLDWILVHSVGNVSWPNTNEKEYVPDLDTEYNYYRFVFTTIYTDGSTNSSIKVNQIKLAGRSRESIAIQDDRVIVFDKLGINNTNPAANLHVSGFSILSGLKIVAVGDSNFQLPVYAQSGSGGGGGGDSTWEANSLGVYVMSNVGIQTTPDTTRALSVMGSVGFYNDTGVATLFSSNNNIGINSPNPMYTLQVQGTTQVAGNLLVNNTAIVKGLVIKKSTSGLPDLSTAIPGIGISNDNLGVNILTNNNVSANYIRFIANVSEIARFSGTGNLGIGVTNPVFKIHLNTDSAGKPSTSTWTVTSDQRLKDNIIDANLDRCYDIVKQIPLRRFTWNSIMTSEYDIADKNKLGWIAQEVEKVFPKAVIYKDMMGFKDCRTLDSDQLYAVVYGSVQKLQFMTEDNKRIVGTLSSKISQLESRMDRIPFLERKLELLQEDMDKLKAENKYMKEIMMRIIKKVGALPEA